MKSRNVKLKQDNMLCNRCMMNVVKSLSQLQRLEEIQVDLESKKIKIKYDDETISKDDIKYIVNQSILNGKIIKLSR